MYGQHVYTHAHTHTHARTHKHKRIHNTYTQTHTVTNMQQMRVTPTIYAYCQQEKSGLYNQPTIYNTVPPVLHLASTMTQIDAHQPSATYAPMASPQPRNKC